MLADCDSDNAFFTAQLAIYAKFFGLKMTEVPVMMRKTGARKSRYKIVRDGKEMLGEMLKNYIRINR